MFRGARVAKAPQGTILASLTIFVWLILLTLLSSQIEQSLASACFQTHPKDPLYRLIGSVKEVLGDTAFLKADSYFHGGVNTGLLKQYHEHLNDLEDHDDEKDEQAFKSSFTDWIFKINSQIKVTEHKHLKGNESKEMLPFLLLSTKLDPYNVPAILTTAHWIDHTFGKTDDAIHVLKQGSENNPGSWEIFYQLGLIYFDRKNDFSQSVPCFEKAVSRMNEKNSAKFERRTAFYHLAESYSKKGLREKALSAYKEMLGLFDDNENLPLRLIISGKIKALSSKVQM